MTPPKPRPGRPRDPALAQRRRDEILIASIHHFAEHGFACGDLDAIAEDAGCAKGTLYRYFESKRELFLQSVDYVMRGLLAATATDPADDPVRQLEQSIRAYLTYFDGHPQYIELLMQERAEFKDRRQPTYFQYRDANRKHSRKLLNALIRAGRFRTIPADRALDVIGNLLYGTISTNHFAGRRTSLEDQADAIIDVLLRGLLNLEEPHKPARR